MHGHDETVAFAVPPDSLPRPRRIPFWVSALLGALTFAGWLGAVLLDAKVFPHNATGSFLVHLPLMLVPAALVLAFGLKRLPDNERTPARMVGAWALVILLTIPALIPELNQHPLWLPLRMPIYGLGLALALVNPGPRLRLDDHGRRKFSPATLAAAGFGVCAITTAFVAILLPQPQSACHEACGELAGLVYTLLCAAVLWTTFIAVIGAALGYRIGEVMRTRWRMKPRVR